MTGKRESLYLRRLKRLDDFFLRCIIGGGGGEVENEGRLSKMRSFRIESRKKEKFSVMSELRL